MVSTPAMCLVQEDTGVNLVSPLGFTRIGEEERRDGEAIALHKTHIWANSLAHIWGLCSAS